MDDLKKLDFKELEKLYQSETIKPTFDYVHIILALIIFGKNNKEGLGRYRLKKELLIGPGTARSLVTKLNENIGFIKVLNEDNKRKGHILTEKGKVYLKKVKEKLPLIKKVATEDLKDIILNADTSKVCLILIRNAADNMGTGIEQRDAAIKVEGLGATCLIFDGKKLHYPYKSKKHEKENKVFVKEKIQMYLKKQIDKEGYHLKQGDVIILGLGDSFKKARLAGLNAAFTLIKGKS
ncbi:MAG: hypothetical protein BAJALOKI2v1_960011 [Promethearchaeota archaeon]|nr:MAG: hypothetical protein BAJALOKI2v1_960011 [Candidatus Lokiarchaeota archaeon]